MSDFATRKRQLVELAVPGVAGTGNTGTSFNFPDQPYLKTLPCWGLEILTVNDVTKSPTGNALITSAILKTAFISLYCTDTDTAPADGGGALGLWLENIPLSDLHYISNGTDPFTYNKFLLTGQKIYWEKSLIKLNTAMANTTTLSFCLMVDYTGVPPM